MAIKLIRSHLANQKLIGRIQSERQILASLNHPNIAGLVDGGSYEGGLPVVAPPVTLTKQVIASLDEYFLQ